MTSYSWNYFERIQLFQYRETFQYEATRKKNIVQTDVLGHKSYLTGSPSAATKSLQKLTYCSSTIQTAKAVVFNQRPSATVAFSVN